MVQQWRPWNQPEERGCPMTTVWVIEQGEYSDYRVVGVFSTKARAEQALAAINKKDEDGDSIGYPASIAEWPLDPGSKELSKGYRAFACVMHRDGTVASTRTVDIEETYRAKPWIWRRTQAPVYRGQQTVDCLCSTVLAKDEVHAIKIVNEQRAQLIARGEWND